MRTIALRNGGETLVDDEDFESLSQWTWKFIKPRNTQYVVRWEGAKAIYMHRVIVQARSGMQVDHIDHNGLNNCRSNLRECTASVNALNRIFRAPHSGFRGVYWDSPRRKWRIEVTIDGKRIRRGRFGTAMEAAKAYNALVLKEIGPLAILNTIPTIAL